jgi:hypothetical protein
MTRRITAFLACMFLCLMNAHSHAAEISCVSLYEGEKKDAYSDWDPKRMPTAYVTCLWGFLNGQISKGDYDKVVAFLRAHHPFIANFSLASPGGDVDEALKIGRIFRRYLFTTWAPSSAHLGADGSEIHDDAPALSFGSRDLCRGPDCICASACALIWMGGVGRIGTVGLHRPRIDDPMFRGLPAADASTAYRRVLESISAYLNEVEVPQSVIESMVATSSNDIHWVSGGPDVDDPPSISEWLAVSCGSNPMVDAILKGKRTTWAEVEKYGGCMRHLYWSGRIEARTGLRMMPTFPRSPLSFRTAGFPQYGWKTGVSGGTFPARQSA